MNRSGFSLTELLIAVAILAIITGIGTATYIDQLARGRDQQRRADVARLQSALERYRADHGGYIDEGWGCESSVGWYVTDCTPGAGTGTTWDPPASNPLHALVTEGYIEELPTDPINNANHHYGYESACGAVGDTDPFCEGTNVQCNNSCCAYQITFNLEEGDGTRIDVCNP